MKEDSEVFPTKLITEKHLKFYYKYGFMVIKGMYSEQQIKSAYEGAQKAIEDQLKSATEQNREPDFSNQSGKKCQEPRMIDYFSFDENIKLCESLVGKFQFKQFQFAPRFQKRGKAPINLTENQIHTIEPFDLEKLPEKLSGWSQKFLKDASQLGIHFAPSQERGWHIDGLGKGKIAPFSILWGSYLHSIPKGRMGNFMVYPGSHHTIAGILRNQGSEQFMKNMENKKPKETIEYLKKERVSDGNAYQVLADPGDIVLAHPWLAHGIANNESDQVRIAMYHRLNNKSFKFEWRSEMAGTDVSPQKKGGEIKQTDIWKGDYFANSPHINKWIKSNGDLLREYDKGELEEALKMQL